MIASRALLAVAAALALQLLPMAARASTPGLVVDASSGRVLFSERATEPWYPASITKLMTTYVALDLVRQGRASLSTLLTMTPGAAAQPPSKIGMKPGQTMTLDNALKIIMVKSANDIAHMIGENLGGGSVEGFAELMNDASRRLGMRESRWVNPSGLPDSRQQTSARDMALLARALILEFPEHEHLFRIGAVQLGPKVMRNHNGLLGRYPGADGMKTGFICSGGFNVVASASRGGTRLITVVMGYGTARERDLRAADLFDLGFTKSGWASATLGDLPPSASFSPPDMRPLVCGAKRRQPQEDDETAMVAAPDQDNPIAAFFAPSAFAAQAAAVPTLGSRRTLGPRVAFTPIPVWLGPAAAGTAEDEAEGAAPVRLAGTRAVRTKRLARASGEAPAGARAFVATRTVAEGETVENVKATAKPVGRQAVKANLAGKPLAAVKPNAGAIGSGGTGGRAKLGAIPAKPAEPAVDGANPDKAKAAKAEPAPRRKVAAGKAEKPRKPAAEAAAR